MQAGLVAGNVVLCFLALSCALGVITWKMQYLIQWRDWLQQVQWMGWKPRPIAKEDVPMSDSGSPDVPIRTGFSLLALPESIRRRFRGHPTDKDLEQDVG